MSTTVAGPETSAVRVALWRALHREIDDAPMVFDDSVALDLADPPANWRARGDMGRSTTRARASIVARARVAEDVVRGRAADGVEQYVVLGAGLDTFAQRSRADLPRMRIFEIDQSTPQRWKQQRLQQIDLSDHRQTFVPVDFEANESWWARLLDSGFDPGRPAVFSSLGVSMYLRAQTTEETFRQIGALLTESTFVLSFRVPTEFIDPGERRSAAATQRGARRTGTPWISDISPDEVTDLAHRSGFSAVEHISPTELTARYFAGRTDGLRPSSIEHLVVATRTAG